MSSSHDAGVETFLLRSVARIKMLLCYIFAKHGYNQIFMCIISTRGRQMCVFFFSPRGDTDDH